MVYNTFKSPLGSLTIATDGTHITELHIAEDRHFSHIPADWIHDPTQPLLQQAGRELKEYFAGQRLTFTLPLQAQGTPFQQQVWRAVQQIPPGSTSTYAAIAQAIGNPLAIRAVGTAIGRNPICVIIPCHRVIASSGSLGGYVAGLERKGHLLKLEQDGTRSTRSAREP